VIDGFSSCADNGKLRKIIVINKSKRIMKFDWSVEMKNIVSVLALILTLPVYAHDFWIWPSNYRPVLNEKVEFTLEVGQDLSGDTMPRINDWYSRFSVIPPSGIEEEVEGELGDDPAGYIQTKKNGVYTTIYRSTRSFVSLGAKKFSGYLVDEGLEWVDVDRAKRGEENKDAHEFYSRAAKSLIQQGEGDATGFDKATGMILEIIPLANPYKLNPGDKLKVKVLYQSQPIKNILVEAFIKAQPEQRERIRTDVNGEVEITLTNEGEWLIKAVHMIRLPEKIMHNEFDEEDLGDKEHTVDWESFWASLTFKL